jgi:hypothetical protein
MSARLPGKAAPAAREEEAPDLSAEAVIESEIVAIAAWLAGQPPSMAAASADAGLPEGERDGFHWRSGYAAGLKRALAMLSSRGMTLH